MKTIHPLCFAALLLASACGGSWSNKDLEFAAALPSRAELSSKLPGAASVQQPLSSVATRRDGLNVGDPSTSYADTQKAAKDFNGLLDFLLGVIDAARLQPPSRRAEDLRVWGPYPDAKTPGQEFQLVVQQVAPRGFKWAMQGRRDKADFVDLVGGAFTAADSVKRGRGAIVVPVKDLVGKVAISAELAQLERIEIGYITDVSPRQVNMVFTFVPNSTSGLSSIGYGSQELADGSGRLAFQWRSLSPVTTRVDIVSVWRADGAGKALGTVAEGTAAGLTKAECWDSSFKVLYAKETWTGGLDVGSAADCPEVPGF